MSLSADILVDRTKRKAELVKWRALTFLLLIALILVCFSQSISFINAPSEQYIARIEVQGILLEDKKRDREIVKIKNDEHVKALIVHINSPGGTIVGGEDLFEAIREVAKVKPVVAVMGSVAASGGYMVAVAADSIFARQGTITGSIGVMLQSIEITELSQKVGVNWKTFKSGELKGAPSPFEKLTPNVSEAIDSSIKDSLNMFVDIVAMRRDMPVQEVVKLADGRIFTGRQAMKVNLVDELGGEREAVEWLRREKGIDSKLLIKDKKIIDKASNLRKLLMNYIGFNENSIGIFNNGGILALWSPASF